MQRGRRKHYGISPVVSTILLVAITVLLAAVLLVMVIGFSPAKIKPIVGFSPAEKKNATAWKIGVADVSHSQPLPRYKVMALHGTAKAVNITSLHKGTVGSYSAPGIGTVTLIFADLTNDGNLGRGDYFIFSFSSAPETGNRFELKILWADDDGELISEDFTT